MADQNVPVSDLILAETRRLRARLADLGLLAALPAPPGLRPDSELVAAAGRTAGTGTPPDRLVAEDRG